MYIYIYTYKAREKKNRRMLVLLQWNEFLYSARCLLRHHMRWDRGDEQKSSAQMHDFCYKGLMRKKSCFAAAQTTFSMFLPLVTHPSARGFGEPQCPTVYPHSGQDAATSYYHGPPRFVLPLFRRSTQLAILTPGSKSRKIDCRQPPSLCGSSLDIKS